MSKKKVIYFWITSLLVSLLAWPPAIFNLLILVAYVPILIVSIKTKSLRQLVITLYSFYYILVLIKTTGLLGEGHFTYGLVLALFVLPILWMMPILALNYLSKKGYLLIGILLFPFLYLINEYWQYFWDLSFIAYHLSFSLGENWLFNSIYPLTGVLGMSFIIISFNSVLAYLYVFTTDNGLIKKKFLHLGFLIVVLIGLPFSLIPIEKKGGNKEAMEMEVAIFSPRTEDRDFLNEDFDKQIEFLIQSIDKDEVNNLDLIIGPEAYLSDLNDNPLFTNTIDQNEAILKLKEICKRRNTSLLIGAILVELIKSDDFPSSSAKLKQDDIYYEIYNGALLISGDKAVQWRTKQILLPFVEKIPFHPYINYLSERISFIPRMNNTYGVKNDVSPFKVNDVRIVTSICYEGLYPLQLAEKVNAQTADLQIILSNDWTIDPPTVSQYETYCHAVGKGTGISSILVNMNEKTVYLHKDGWTNRFENYPLSVKRIQLN